jgi:hypothetical protein
MKKVKLGLQRGYSRNMPPKVFNGASDVCFAGKNGANEGGRSDSAKLWWGHFRCMMFQDRGGQTWPGWGANFNGALRRQFNIGIHCYDFAGKVSLVSLSCLYASSVRK